MTHPAPQRLSAEELLAEAATALPAKEVISLLDVNVDVDLALALAAPIDLAVAANAQAALPINAGVSANLLGVLSTSGAVANQGTLIDQAMRDVSAYAEADQTATVEQGDTDVFDDADGAESAATILRLDDPVDGGLPDDAEDTVDGPVEDVDDTVGDVVGDVDDAVDDAVGDVGDTVDDAVGDVGDTLDDTVDGTLDAIDDVIRDVGGAIGDVAETIDLSDGLLNINVNVELDADLAAPIAGAVAANAQVAAPINASVAANIGTVGSEAIAVADQTAIITQQMRDVTATAIADQDATVEQ